MYGNFPTKRNDCQKKTINIIRKDYIVQIISDLEMQFRINPILQLLLNFKR